MAPYYQDDYITLHLGDSALQTEWAEADCLITDPPYGVQWTQSFGRYQLHNQTHNRGVIAGDNNTEMRDTILGIWGPNKPAAIFGTWKQPRPAGTLTALLIWDKQGMQPGPANSAFLTTHEEIYIYGRGWRATSPPMRSVITTRETRHHQPRKTGHPTGKPQALMLALTDRAPTGVITDPFAGTGATLIAAKALGRQAIGCEISEAYCEIAANRLAQECLAI